MATKKEMIAAANDLNKRFGLDPLINVKAEWTGLLADLLEFKADSTPEEANQMQPETLALLKSLNKKSKPPAPVKKEKAPVKKTESPDFIEPVEGTQEEKVEKPVKAPVKTKKKAGTPVVKKPGVISTIVQLIEKAGKEGITKESILAGLEKEFPEREAKSMKNTINVQVPARINKERFKVENLGEGLYRKAS